MTELERCRQRVDAADQLRSQDPGRALDEARTACEVAAACESESLDWQLLQAEAWAVLASAYRSVGDLRRSEGALNVALELVDDLPEVHPTTWARLAQRACYLRCSQKRFAEALSLSNDVLGIYQQQGDEPAAAAALVDRALILARAGDPRKAITVLSRCLEALDPQHDAKNHLAAVHNMAYYRLQVAETEAQEQEALQWLEKAKQCHRRRPEPLGLLQLQAMAAVTAIRFGRRRQGTESLWQVYHGFGELRALPEQILTLLHLAECAVGACDDDEVTRIAGLIFPLLGKTPLPETARSALLRFLNAARSRSVTRELVTHVTDELQQAVGG